jgi:phosphate transport system substrate-binding protein
MIARATRWVAWALAAALPALAPCAPASAAATITVAGSTTLLPLIDDAAQAYESVHTDVLLVVSGGGSRAALAQLAGKQIDMAASDIPAGDTGDLVAHPIAVIGFAIAVDPRSGVTSLTRAQIADVFAGHITNWKDVGGSDLAIAVVNRPAGSGVRSLLAKRLMSGDRFATSPLEDEATGSLVDDLKGHPGSIGYGSFAGLRDAGLTLVAIDGVEPNDENIEDGTYPLWAYEYIVTNGQPSPDASRFLAFLETSRNLLHRHGYIAVRDMKVQPAGT